jgi:hypothetical protein
MLLDFIGNLIGIVLCIFVFSALWFLYQNSPNAVRNLKADLRDVDEQLNESEYWAKYWYDQWQDLHTEALLSGNHHVCDICYSNKKKGKGGPS